MLLVHAHVDGELDPANALALERQIADNPALAAERARVEALRDVLRKEFPRKALPPHLRDANRGRGRTASRHGGSVLANAGGFRRAGNGARQRLDLVSIATRAEATGSPKRRSAIICAR